MSSSRRGQVMGFRVSLTDIDPEIWRMIDVPGTYSFWDFHVAIQDAMGWLDYHLHWFIPQRTSDHIESPIGIPDDLGETDTIAGWDVPLKRYFTAPGDTIGYEYDFGDGWFHSIELIEVYPKEPKQKYPRCVAGARACPPEDCGGVPGYYELLTVLSDPSREDYAEMVGWLKGHAKNYYPYDPDAFDPDLVHFDNPKKRFKAAFES